MAYFKREGGSRGGPRGGKSFGGGGGGFKSRGGFGGPRGGQGGGFGDRGPVELYEATCAECGKATQVPFRPNGKKPVFCRDCFKKQEGNEERGGFDRKPGYGEKRSYDAAPRAAAAPRDTRIDEINTKLDHILRILENVEIEGADDEDKA